MNSCSLFFCGCSRRCSSRIAWNNATSATQYRLKFISVFLEFVRTAAHMEHCLFAPFVIVGRRCTVCLPHVLSILSSLIWFYFYHFFKRFFRFSLLFAPYLLTFLCFRLCRQTPGNGTLYFPPFLGQYYRADVHEGIYRCRASNQAGTILSREVHIRAGIKMHAQKK